MRQYYLLLDWIWTSGSLSCDFGQLAQVTNYPKFGVSKQCKYNYPGSGLRCSKSSRVELPLGCEIEPIFYFFQFLGATQYLLFPHFDLTHPPNYSNYWAARAWKWGVTLVWRLAVWNSESSGSHLHTELPSWPCPPRRENQWALYWKWKYSTDPSPEGWRTARGRTYMDKHIA